VSCPEIDRVEAYASGERIDADERTAIAAHLAHCPLCAELLTDVSENLVLEKAARALGTSSVTAAAASQPEIRGFRILQELGRGGMGVVYLAEQERPRRQVALKVLRPGLASPDVLRRFEREADLLAQLQHPAIAQVYEAGTADGVPYLAMEHVRGSRLDEFLRDTKLDTRQRLRLLARICDALQHAHAHGVLHRDLKPSNILVTRPDADAEASGPEPKIVDFGVARATDCDLQAASLRTEIGQLLGTVPFMSPEQVLGDSSQLDARSDVYALGVIGYWMLAGELPYALGGRSVPEAVRIIRDEDPVTLSSVAPAYRGDVETIIGKALEKDRDRRYGSAAELAGDIRRHLADEPIAARPPSAAYQFAKFARRNRAAAVAGAVVAAVLVVAAVGGSLLAVRATRAERAARTQLERAESAAARQEAIREFLQGMLASANPYGAGDTETTVQQVLDGAAAELDAGRLAASPDIEIALRRTLANTFWSLARFEAAETQFRAALATRDGAPPEERLESLSDFGLLLAELNRYAEAESVMRDLHQQANDALGPDHVLTAKSLGGLAGVLSDAGNRASAESVLTHALERSARLTGRDRAVHASNLYSLGGLRFFAGDLEGAERAMRQALELRRELYGSHHPEVVAVLEGLGVVYGQRQDYDAQTTTFREVLTARREIFGDDHPAVASTLTNLGTALSSHGRLEEAEPLLREAVAINRETRGNDHQESARCLNDLAQVLRRRERPADAEPLYREAAAGYETVLGPEHPSVATVRRNLGLCLVELGRTDEAREQLGAALAIRRSALGDEHAATVAVREDLAKLAR
jgi:tetratricopeptide (TPR) repeat protein/predicted Ser/Thr protein kinase